MDTPFEPRIVAFVCNWCTYAGADLAGTSRTPYASNVRIIKLPCTGRISPLFVLKAFERGADGVLISGCHPGDCHYSAGNYHARRKFTVLRELMAFLGEEPERLQFSWVSAAEGKKWADVVNEVTAGVRQLGPRRRPWGDGERSRIPVTHERRTTHPVAPVEVTTPNAPMRSRSTPLPRHPEPRATQPNAPIEATQPNAPMRSHSTALFPTLNNEQRTTTQETELRAKARELLEQGAVGVVVGYGRGSLPGIARPLFVTSPQEAEQLIWNDHCSQNLSVYLTRDIVKKLGRVAMVMKGCDERSLIGLMQENQVAREDVTLLGVACGGMQVDGRPASKCVACPSRTPSFADHVIGEAVPSPPGVEDPRAAEVAHIERMAPSDRRAYWGAQFSRCLRCYACRAVCPLCYCERCLADKTQPRWVSSQADGPGNLSWHASRALHLSGRCADCGACVQACPAGIRLDLLNRKMAQVVQDAFGYVPGRDPSAAPPLTMFREDDRQAFIR